MSRDESARLSSGTEQLLGMVRLHKVDIFLMFDRRGWRGLRFGIAFAFAAPA